MKKELLAETAVRETETAKTALRVVITKIVKTVRITTANAIKNKKILII
jgi:hypothetical protein